MSWVRWSSLVRKDCPTCKGTRGLSERDRIIYEVVGIAVSRCPTCSSCWYVWDDVDGTLHVEHAARDCPHKADPQSWQLPYDEALAWRPPEDCHMPEVALAAVEGAVAAHQGGSTEPQESSL